MKLQALDSEDLQIIATYTQDGLLLVGEVQYLPKEKTLIIPMNRFAWENEQEGTKTHERHRSVLTINRVEALKTQNIDQSKKQTILSLLTIDYVENSGPSGVINLVFAGGAVLAVGVECIEVQLADMGAAWQTDNLPHHNV
ncbi:DUF2948 family protein [Polycladidibacter stylochi]|uniref:DUF2948 family protein n=1 Tax=Polycladidibacter stylochi TaxID=1807766 RepID=UPI000831C118|nr:DUF2948 family protein [Pseudovibrio stylochi]